MPSTEAFFGNIERMCAAGKEREGLDYLIDRLDGLLEAEEGAGWPTVGELLSKAPWDRLPSSVCYGLIAMTYCVRGAIDGWTQARNQAAGRLGALEGEERAARFLAG